MERGSSERRGDRLGIAVRLAKAPFAVHFASHFSQYKTPIPYSESTRPMSNLLSPLHSARRLRIGLFATMAVASVTLLGACSIWPKALTLQSEPAPPEPAAVQVQPAQATAPTACQDCQDSTKPSTAAIAQGTVTPVPLEPRPEVAAVAAAEPAKADTSPAGKVQSATLPSAAHSAAAPRTVPASGLVPGFYINVGLFAVPTNGKNAYQKLESAGLPVFSDGVESKKGPLTRVRVGPFSTRAQATAAAKKIRALKLDAIVFRH